MEKYTLPQDIKVFGEQVTTFPLGIAETFEKLAKMIGDENRSFYGISYIKQDGEIAYFATALEMQDGEAEHYNYSRYIIDKGEYLCETLHGWMQKTGLIKTIFGRLTGEECPSKERPAIEWYKSDEEMVCMVRNS